MSPCDQTRRGLQHQDSALPTRSLINDLFPRHVNDPQLKSHFCLVSVRNKTNFRLVWQKSSQLARPGQNWPETSPVNKMNFSGDVGRLGTHRQMEPLSTIYKLYKLMISSALARSLLSPRGCKLQNTGDIPHFCLAPAAISDQSPELQSRVQGVQ